jgi:hypothetical protein
MNMNASFNLGFRTYAVAAAAVALLTVASVFDAVSLPATALGAAWVLLALLGAVVIVGMTARKQVVLLDDQSGQELERFETTDLTGLPLNAYVVFAAMWAAVSFGWLLGGRSLDALFTIGYGWLAVAAYGAILAVGLAVHHSRDISEAVAPNGGDRDGKLG